MFDMVDLVFMDYRCPSGPALDRYNPFKRSVSFETAERNLMPAEVSRDSNSKNFRKIAFKRAMMTPWSIKCIISLMHI
jgi:hypothetical protein